MNLYLFDFDKTLYAYDSRFRLPALARATGASQYRLASSWWAAGFERRAESGEWADAEAYLDEFARVTGGRRLSLAEWAAARRTAMTPDSGVIAALARSRERGTVSLLSNNPSAFAAALPLLAPDVAELVGRNRLTSAELGARKPGPVIFERALARFGAAASDCFFVDDSRENVEGALAAGLVHAHHYTTVEDLDAALERFEDRDR